MPLCQTDKKKENDVLFHFALSTDEMDFKSTFGDVKYVLCGGSANRMLKIAEHLMENVPIQLSFGTQLKNLSRTDRYVLYKLGPVLCVNHGIGQGSCLIMLHEITKLLRHANVKDPIYIRMGTCGGIGLKGGTIVISENVYNGSLQPGFETYQAGKRRVYDCTLDKRLIQMISDTCELKNIRYEKAITMGNNDFYEEQGRCDGALCSFKPEERDQFLKKCYEIGIRNFEMESACFASFCKRAGIRGAVICVTLLDRMKGDQMTESKETYENYEMTLLNVLTELLKMLIKKEKS